MPAEARATFVTFTDATQLIERCLECQQYWELTYSGRLDIPTYVKLSSQEGRDRVNAWIKAMPEREARAAQRDEELRKRELDWQAQAEQAKQADLKLASPLSRTLRILTVLCSAVGTIIAFIMIFQGGEPAPKLLVTAGAAFLSGLVLAGWHAWRNR
jgi:hypothetical protein